MTRWDDIQYLRFSDERTRAARELLARVPLEQADQVVDLGCGPGNSTALLHARWPRAHIRGVDNSAEMLRSARQALPALEWIQADLADPAGWQADTPVDLLFANAVLHWLPDHATLLPRLLGMLRPGGVLALQMPSNDHEPSHRLMRELPGPWQARLQQVGGRTAVLPAAFYYDVLAPHAARVDLWQTTYEQVMPDPAAIVEWVKGSGLRPYLEALRDDAERSEFLAAYTAAIDAAYPARSDGRRLFTFPRVFVVAVR